MRVGWQAVTFLAVSTTVLSACGGGGEPGSTEQGGEGAGAPAYAGLDAYERRCEDINRRGARARVVYEASKEMKVGDADTVRAAVTLDRSAPPRKVLPRTDAASESGLVVSCRLQARLTASRDEFEIADTDWIDRSVYATDTARWVWTVSPKLGGDHTLTLLVRPIVRKQEEGRASETSLAREADIRDYATRVHVSVPWNERPEEVMTQIASTLNVAEGLVKALAALAVALGALWAATRGLRRRRKKRADSSETPTKAE